jgi:adenylate kinase
LTIRALLLAPPGAGKGTQGVRIAERHGATYIATGDMLRRHVASGTPIGRKAQAYMLRGDLVPDELIVALVTEAVAGDPPLDAYVLDGFPRTLVQAHAAYEWGAANDRTFHAVISLAVPTDELVRRLLARGRADDTEATVRNRLDVYAESTEPLFDFYRKRNILLEVDGTGSVDDVTGRIEAALAERGIG